jgi:hypothetical protein
LRLARSTAARQAGICSYTLEWPICQQATQRGSPTGQSAHLDTEQDQQIWSEFFERMDSLKKQIVQWYTTACPTARTLALNEARLSELQK